VGESISRFRKVPAGFSKSEPPQRRFSLALIAALEFAMKWMWVLPSAGAPSV